MIPLELLKFSVALHNKDIFGTFGYTLSHSQSVFLKITITYCKIVYEKDTLRARFITHLCCLNYLIYFIFWVFFSHLYVLTLLLVFHLVPMAFSFNLYIENSIYLAIVTVSCKQIHKGKSWKFLEKFFLGYYEKKNVALDQQEVKGRGNLSNFDFKNNST